MIIYAKTSDECYRVKVVGQSADQVIKCHQFQSGLDRFDHALMELRLINIQSADILEGGRVIFVKMECEVVDRQTGKMVPGIVFLRGNSLSILTFLVCEETGEVFVVVTEQARVPLGSARYLEVPAGMMDHDGDSLVSRALAELEQETGLVVTRDMLNHLGSYFPSAGGCDEMIDCFTVTIRVTQAQMAEIVDSLHGVDDECERIFVRVYSLFDFLSALRDGKITDGKAFTAVMMLLLKNDQVFDWIWRQVAFFALSS